MRLRWREIEPELAGRAWSLRERAALTHASAPASLGLVWSFFALTMALMIGALYLTLFLHLTGPAGTMALAVCPVLLGIAVLGPHASAVAPRGALDPALLRFALEAPETPRVERRYGETVLLLAETPLPRAAAREMLRQVNALVADERRLTRQRDRIVAGIDPEAVARAEADRSHLAGRLDTEADPIARQSLLRGVALCDERLESLYALPRALARLDAHHEMVCQALELAHATLLRVRSAGMALSPPEIDGLHENLRQLAHQAQAAEEALMEIEGLR